MQSLDLFYQPKLVNVLFVLCSYTDRVGRGLSALFRGEAEAGQGQEDRGWVQGLHPAPPVQMSPPQHERLPRQEKTEERGSGAAGGEGQPEH